MSPETGAVEQNILLFVRLYTVHNLLISVEVNELYMEQRARFVRTFSNQIQRRWMPGKLYTCCFRSAGTFHRHVCYIGKTMPTCIE